MKVYRIVNFLHYVPITAKGILTWGYPWDKGYFNTGGMKSPGNMSFKAIVFYFNQSQEGLVQGTRLSGFFILGQEKRNV